MARYSDVDPPSLRLRFQALLSGSPVLFCIAPRRVCSCCRFGRAASLAASLVLPLDGMGPRQGVGKSWYGVPMPRYHFVVYGKSVIRDPEGGLFVSDQAAMAYGARLARELIADSGVNCAGWSIGVENEQGHRIALIPFTTVQ